MKVLAIAAFLAPSLADVAQPDLKTYYYCPAGTCLGPMAAHQVEEHGEYTCLQKINWLGATDNANFMYQFGRMVMPPGFKTTPPNWTQSEVSDMAPDTVEGYPLATVCCDDMALDQCTDPPMAVTEWRQATTCVADWECIFAEDRPCEEGYCNDEGECDSKLKASNPDLMCSNLPYDDIPGRSLDSECPDTKMCIFDHCATCTNGGGTWSGTGCSDSCSDMNMMCVSDPVDCITLRDGMVRNLNLYNACKAVDLWDCESCLAIDGCQFNIIMGQCTAEGSAVDEYPMHPKWTESCPKTCKKSKDCSQDPCKPSTCNLFSRQDDARFCIDGDEIVCDVDTETCEGGVEKLDDPSTCCGKLPCGVTDVCHIDVTGDAKADKKKCKKRRKALKDAGVKCQFKNGTCKSGKVKGTKACKKLKSKQCADRADCKPANGGGCTEA